MPRRVRNPGCISDVLLNSTWAVEQYLSWPSYPYVPGSEAREAIDKWLEQTAALRSMLDTLPTPSFNPNVMPEVLEVSDG